MSDLFDEEDLEILIERKPRKVTALWTQKDGSKLRICDMSDSHLINAIRLLQRRAKELKDVEPPCFNGEMAQLEVDIQYAQLQHMDVEDFFPIYVKLLEEVYRRKLNDN